MWKIFKLPWKSQYTSSEWAEKEFNAIFDLTSTGAAQANPFSGEFLKVNKKICELTGYNESELLEKTFYEITHPEDRTTDLLNIQKSLKGEEPIWKSVKRYVRKDGATIWVRVTGTVIRDQFAIPRRTIALIEDINEVQEAKKAQEKNESLMRLIADALPVLISYIGPDLKYQFVNKSYERWFKKDRQQILGQFVGEFLGKEAFEQVYPYLKKGLAGEATHVDVQLPYTTAGSKYVQLHYIPDIDNHGKTRGLFVLVIDLTEQKQTEDELSRARQAAEAASRAKSAFLANISHEIRTPLTAILGFSELLSQPQIPDFRRTEYTRIIQRNGDHLLRLINDVLDLAGIESDRLSYQFEEFSLRELLNDITDLFQNLAIKKDLQWKITEDPNIPLRIETDPLRLKQILVNLVSNAIKFTEKGSVGLHVFMKDTEPESIFFEVQDTGPGLDENQMRNLFSPFSKTRYRKRDFEGAGLGLALSKRLARDLGGDLILKESITGRGACFQTWIKTHQPLARGGSPPSPEKDQIVTLSQRKILVAEDVYENWLLVKTILEAHGATAHHAQDGLITLQMTQMEKYDLILMDLMMPNLDGYATTQQLRQHGFKTPIIIFSAFSSPEDLEKLKAAGCDDYINKPITSSALITKIAKLILANSPERV